MSGVLGRSVLDEDGAVDVEVWPFIDEVQFAGCSESALNKAILVIRNMRGILQRIPQDELWRYQTVEVGQLLASMQGGYSLQNESGLFSAPIDEAIMHVTGADLDRMHITLASILHDCSVLLTDPRFDDQAVVPELREILSSRRIERSNVPSGLGYSVKCDGKNPWGDCYERSRSYGSQQKADDEAQKLGWFVSAEKDLCPKHNDDAAPLPQPSEDGPIPPPDLQAELALVDALMGVEPPIPPGGHSTEEESVEAVLMGVHMIQAHLNAGETASGLIMRLEEMFGAVAIREAAGAMLPDERIFEILKTQDPPVVADEVALREVFAALRSRAEPPVPA